MSLSNDLTNAARVIYQSFGQTMAGDLERWKRAGFLIPTRGNTLELHSFIETGDESTMTGSSDSLANSDLKSGKAQFSPAYKAKGMQFFKDELLNYSDFDLAQIGATMANRAFARYQDVFFAGVGALFSTNHPLAGTGLGQVGASKKYIDTGLYYNQTLSSAATQDNLLSAQLSPSTFALARQRMREWRSSSGEKLLLGATGLVLLVDESNLDLALQITKSAVADLNLQVNTNAQSNTTVISYPMASPDDWFVIDPAQSPVGIWSPSPPSLFIGQDTTRDLWVYLTTKYTAKFVYRPESDGIIGSNVP